LAEALHELAEDLLGLLVQLSAGEGHGVAGPGLTAPRGLAPEPAPAARAPR
jgi:hypothetical protein